jgi:hypothetical protein
MSIAVGDLVIVSSFTPEIIPERLAIFIDIDEGHTKGPFEICRVLTSNGIEEVNFYLIYPLDRREDEQP